MNVAATPIDITRSTGSVQAIVHAARAVTSAKSHRRTHRIAIAAPRARAGSTA
ncbi:hypothetical protein [Paraburkholderia acidisoli]|uniref:Uncharacterized protein n=1 Tax=Paraburkholderia acidisoli TaxID=2571748 RepID=A0A7Z2JHB8_9BURK|nr:hypothetical protein [Paraburkholderia acidisoli]QGZ63264.1 hypothetical protein FAZ98_15785 [Paraburkholderia acidisoli]